MDKMKPTDIIYRWRVRGHFISIILSVFLAKPNIYSLLSGIGFVVLGLLLRGWACGHLKKEKRLAVSGPYKYTRNPLYLGNLIIGMGIVAGARSWWVLAIFIAYFLKFYPVVIIKEKNKMQQLFPQEYKEYSSKVPLFIPSLKPYAEAPDVRFNWAIYKKNKELRALIWGIIFWIILFLKMILF